LNRFEKGKKIATDSLRRFEAALLQAAAQFVRRGGRIGATVPLDD